MGLVSPLSNNNSGYQIGHKISEDNLYTLLNARTKEDVTTPVALQAFKDYQNSKTGIGHQIKKFTFSVAAYGTTIGIPVGLVIGGTVWALKDYWANPAKVAYDIGNAFYEHTPMISPGNAVFGGLAPYTTPQSGLVAIGAIGAVDLAFYKAVGVAPAVAVAKWSVLMMSTALAFAAKQAGDMVARSYDKQEDLNVKSGEQAQKVMFDQLKTTYDDMAEDFLKDCELAKDSPKKMIEMTTFAELMQKQFPVIKSQLMKLELPSSSVDQIMSKLVTIMGSVKHAAFNLRSPEEKGAQKYNTELLSIITNDEFASKVVSKAVQRHVDTAKANTLGTMHTVKSYAAAGVTGAANAVVATAVISGLTHLVATYAFGFSSKCSSSVNATNCANEAGIVAVSSLPGIAHGINVASRVHSAFVRERKAADNRKVEQTDLALTKLIETYNGIATNLKHQLYYAKNDAQKMNQLVADAESILAKVPMIKREIADTGVIVEPSIVTEELETILAQILPGRSEAQASQVFAYANLFAQAI